MNPRASDHWLSAKLPHSNNSWDTPALCPFKYYLKQKKVNKKNLVPGKASASLQLFTNAVLLTHIRSVFLPVICPCRVPHNASH